MHCVDVYFCCRMLTFVTISLFIYFVYIVCFFNAVCSIIFFWFIVYQCTLSVIRGSQSKNGSFINAKFFQPEKLLCPFENSIFKNSNTNAHTFMQKVKCYSQKILFIRKALYETLFFCSFFYFDSILFLKISESGSAKFR